MKISEYIVSKLQKAILEFKGIQFKYKLSDYSSDHIILVRPEVEFANNEEYVKWENSFWNECAEKYPEELVFCVFDSFNLTDFSSDIIFDSNLIADDKKLSKINSPINSSTGTSLSSNTVKAPSKVILPHPAFTNENKSRKCK